MSPRQEIKIQSTEFQPRNTFILVKPEELVSEKTTQGGIIIPMNNRSVTERPTSGIVIGVGEGVEDINEGDFVIWPNTDGIDFEFNDGHFMLLRYESIIGSKKA